MPRERKLLKRARVEANPGFGSEEEDEGVQNVGATAGNFLIRKKARPLSLPLLNRKRLTSVKYRRRSSRDGKVRE